MIKLFYLCYNEYVWDSLSKWFIEQFYFTKTIETMQKSNGFTVAFLEIRDYCPSLVFVMWLLVRLGPLGARQIEDGGKGLKIRKKRIVSGIEQPWYFSFYFTSFYPEIEFLSNLIILYSMKIKEQTRKLAVGCSKHSFEVADGSWRGLKRFSKSIN